MCINISYKILYRCVIKYISVFPLTLMISSQSDYPLLIYLNLLHLIHSHYQTFVNNISSRIFLVVFSVSASNVSCVSHLGVSQLISTNLYPSPSPSHYHSSFLTLQKIFLCFLNFLPEPIWYTSALSFVHLRNLYRLVSRKSPILS